MMREIEAEKPRSREAEAARCDDCCEGRGHLNELRKHPATPSSPL